MDVKDLKRYIKEQKDIIKSYELAIDTLVDKVNVYKDNVYRAELELETKKRGKQWTR